MSCQQCLRLSRRQVTRMLDLANKYWDWRAVKLEIQRVKDIEKATLATARKKYGVYMDMAKNHKDKPLYLESLELTKLFEECIESGVTESKAETHYCHAKFGNGWSVKYWIGNKMYAYARGAEFLNPEGKKICHSESIMPQFYMCFFMEEKIEKVKRVS